jgi:hypothetical protein
MQNTVMASHVELDIIMVTEIAMALMDGGRY